MTLLKRLWHFLVLRRSPKYAVILFFLGAPGVALLLSAVSRTYWALIKNTELVQSGHWVQSITIAACILYALFAYIILLRSAVNITSTFFRRIFRFFVLSILLIPIVIELATRYGYLTLEITITGEISPSTFTAFKQFVDKSIITPRTLIVASQGGDIPSALAIGTLVHQLGMDVNVREFCASSCANYIFPAGKNKRISNNALILYHGGMHQQNVMDLSSQLETAAKTNSENIRGQVFGARGKEVTLRVTPETERINKRLVNEFLGYIESDSMLDNILNLRTLEGRFFKSMQVDPKITIYGQTGDFQKLYESYNYLGFYYSLKEMELMGIHNIVVDGGKWEPEKNQKIDQVYLAKIHGNTIQN